MHFETIFFKVTAVFYFQIYKNNPCSLSYSVLRRGILISGALTLSRLYDFSDIVTKSMYCNDNFFSGGGGGGKLAILGESFYPTNILDRTLLPPTIAIHSLLLTHFTNNYYN